MSPNFKQLEEPADVGDELSRFVAEAESVISQQGFHEAARFLLGDAAASWFGFAPARLLAVLEEIVATLGNDEPWIQASYRMLTSTSVEQFENPSYLATLKTKNRQERFMLAMLRMSNFRKHGRPAEALEQCHQMQQHLGMMQTMIDSHRGWAFQVAIQTGITAILAGDFNEALMAFTQAQMHTPVSRFAFLSRDALIKSALIHVCCGNAATAESFLTRAKRIPRTSSWYETHLDSQRDLVLALLRIENPKEALAKLWAISLDGINQMWPFYVLALYRILEACGYDDKLHHQLEVLDAMSFARVDGVGFTGSIIPVKRAMLQLKAGNIVEAQQLLDRADPQLPYTQLIQAAAQIYRGRPDQAIREAAQMHCTTRGFRFLELRRLAVLAAGQYQADEYAECIQTLRIAAAQPTGLNPTETVLFSPETRRLAADHIPSWPSNDTGPSKFLTAIPEPVRTLTSREVEILEQLAQGCTRAQAAQNLFVTVNTLKTQLRSIYRKLNVSSAADAVSKAKQRGLMNGHG